jgi:hypothetical protein
MSVVNAHMFPNFNIRTLTTDNLATSSKKQYQHHQSEQNIKEDTNETYINPIQPQPQPQPTKNETRLPSSQLHSTFRPKKFENEDKIQNDISDEELKLNIEQIQNLFPIEFEFEDKEIQQHHQQQIQSNNQNENEIRLI